MRNSFLRQALLFLTPLVVLATLVELRLARKPENLYGDKARLLRADSGWRAVVVGASHSMFGVDPSVVDENAFNFAFPYETPELTDALLERVLTDVPSVRTVYCGISYFSFRARLSEMPAQAWRQYNYTRILGTRLPADVWEMLDLRNYSWFFALTTPVAKAELRGRPVGREWQGLRNDGWIPLVDISENLRTDAITSSRLKFYADWMRPENIVVNRRALHHLVATARARGARVVFYTVPVSPSFLRLADPQVVAERKQEMEALVAGEPGAVYLDFFETHDLTEQLFFDTDHLNHQGAPVFSQRLRTALASSSQREVSRF